MSGQATLKATPSAISSPVLVAGPTRYDLLASQILQSYGPEAPPANLSAKQAKARGLMTSATSGPTSSGSSASAALTLCLESSLQARMRLTGSTLYRLTWKARVTPLGRRISALRAWAPRTSGSASTGWVTPAARDWKDSAGMSLDRTRADRATSSRADQLPRQALLCGWPTATACDSNRAPAQNFKPTPNMTLNHAAVMVGWPTPTASLATKGVDPNPEAIIARNRKSGQDLGAIATLTGWPTPAAQSPQSLRGKGADPMKRQAQGRQINLTDAVNWIDLNNPARLTASGEMLTGCSAEMPSGGQLDPAHSLWLQGYPTGFLSCGLRAMLSMPTRRKSSSKPRSKPLTKDTE